MAGKSVTVIGAGGNIGSHLAPHLGRMPGVERVTLVNRDVYEATNLASQDITPGDVGKPKAAVQGQRLRRINPGLRVAALAGAVEDLPLGQLRGDAILACVDSRRARQHINEIAWRLGTPWIDAGVQAEGLLARVNVYVPGDGPCLECAWSDSDYATIGQVYPCQRMTEEGSTPTGAPSSLGALAAALQALECQKLLAGQTEQLAVGRQVTIDARWHKHYVTAFRRNPNCRFDHKTRHIEKLACLLEKLTVGQALKLGGDLRLEDKPFIKRLSCPACGRARALLRLACSLRPAEWACPKCGRRMSATGFDLLERLDAALPAKLLARSLGRIGLRAGDVFSAGARHYEIVCDPVRWPLFFRWPFMQLRK